MHTTPLDGAAVVGAARRSRRRCVYVVLPSGSGFRTRNRWVLLNSIFEIDCEDVRFCARNACSATP